MFCSTDLLFLYRFKSIQFACEAVADETYLAKRTSSYDAELVEIVQGELLLSRLLHFLNFIINSLGSIQLPIAGSELILVQGLLIAHLWNRIGAHSRRGKFINIEASERCG